MLFSFCIILFIESVKILIQCVSFPRMFNKSGIIPSGPADFFSFIFFICCVTSAVVGEIGNRWVVLLDIREYFRIPCGYTSHIGNAFKSIIATYFKSEFELGKHFCTTVFGGSSVPMAWGPMSHPLGSNGSAPITLKLRSKNTNNRKSFHNNIPLFERHSTQNIKHKND